MLIYFATVFDSTNVHTWSGLGYYIGEMLKKQGHEIVYLNDLKMPNAFYHRIKKHVLHKCFGKTYSPYFSTQIAKHYAQQIKSIVPKGAVIFSPNTILLSHLGKVYKKILFTDSTFQLLLDFYPSFSNISGSFKHQAQEIELTALQNADLLIYTSKWAASSAINYYHIDSKKIAIAPFGANINIKIKEAELPTIIQKRNNDQVLHLVLVAVAWYRKGGDYAVQVLNTLRAKGINAKLHVVGMRKLPSYVDDTHIIQHGFISKAHIEGQEYLAALYKNSHFLILPSRADCTPVCVSEANSFGLPCLISATGGNKDIVEKDLNGNLFDFTQGPEKCVEYIMQFKENSAAYQHLCISSYKRYAEELNWETTGNKITALLKTLAPVTQNSEAYSNEVY